MIKRLIHKHWLLSTFKNIFEQGFLVSFKKHRARRQRILKHLQALFIESTKLYCFRCV